MASSSTGRSPLRKYAAPTLEPPKAAVPTAILTTLLTPTPGRRTRSGAEYSPWANAVALCVPHVLLTHLLHRRDDGPDSDTESLDDSDSDDEAPPLRLTPPKRPRRLPLAPQHSFELPNGLMPGPVIRVVRPPPPQKKPTAAEVKARRLVKKHARDRGVRFLDREQQRVNAGSRLKAVTRLRVRQTAPVLRLNLSIDEYAAPVAASGWQAIRQDEHDVRHYDLDEIRRTRPDMQVYDWDGTPTPIIDADRNILLLLGGFPPKEEAWGTDVADKAAKGMEEAAKEIYTGAKWRRRAGLNEPVPRRGSHAAKHVGVAMGGGQRYPQNLAHAARNLVIFAGLFGLKSLQRIAGWTSVLFMAFAPQLHEYYRSTYAALCDWDRIQQRAKHIRRNFPERTSVFTTATFNFGPVTVTLPHIDFGNLAWGWCAVTALGNFDPDRGGHLVLWDLNLIIRFPPGSTILLPSAILRHSNLQIGPNETRFSFTQFTPAGIFRWVYNDFRTDKDINAAKSTTEAEREQRRQDRASRWQEGIRMYTKWDGPARSI
ncbi:hypothetical protein C8F04DRAFT_1269665 [Mycena alexandri]|uniref:Uncharacterized protein n=1 Tax=Mycena alexandri TaxID=1745969 RepID=A0AAD6WS40_9AGAR|nr:hypothetical protein C8F04DRAFT_1269665 [Mycena alexandri]